MSQQNSGDGDRTSIQTEAPATQRPMTLDPDALVVEEPTMQPSLLVERITPVPPGRNAALMEPRGKPPGFPPPTDVSADAPTAAVQNPGSRPPAGYASDRPTLAVPTGPLRVNPASVGAMEPSMTPMSKGPGDAPPNVDTAYVPIPGQAAQLPAALAQQTVIASPQAVPKKPNLVEWVKGSRNARLGIIVGAGMLGIVLPLLLIGPRPKPRVPVAPMVEASSQPSTETKESEQKQPEKEDPAKNDEKDVLLEKAVLAVESGRTDEALALFRRYTEEDPSPAAEFMVQFLQLQISQSGKER